MQKQVLSEDEVLIQAAKTLDDKPIIITLFFEPKKRFDRFLMWLRLKPSKAVFTIAGATLRTMIRISRLLLSIKYFEKPEEGEGQLVWAYQGIVDNAELSVKIIATAIHNEKSEHPASLEDLILDGLDSKNHQKIAFNIIKKLDVFTFMNTITSIRTMNILKEVSPQPEEIIAPEKTISGEELETLSNILGSAGPK